MAVSTPRALRRRRKPGDGRALTASAMVLPLGSRNLLRKIVPKIADWQTEALDYFDTTPELKYTTLWVGNAMSKVKLYVAVEGPDGEAVAVDARDGDGKLIAGVPDTVVAQAVAELDRLRRNSPSGVGGLLREFAVNVDLAGECYLVGIGKREAFTHPTDPTKSTAETAELWDVHSISAVEVKGDGTTTVASEPGDQMKRRLDPEFDTAIRLYQRHARWQRLADSHVRAVLTQCRLLQVLEGQILAESMSRHNAGILVVDAQATWGGKSPADSDEQQDGEDPFMSGLTDAITAPVADPGDPSSVVPNLVRANDIDKAMKWVQIGRDTGDALDARIDKRVERLAGGLNVPKEVVIGHRATTFANADQISDDEFTDHLEPRVLLACDAFSYGFLRPQLVDAGGESATWAPKLFLWYDASALLDPPDMATTATEALRNFAISWPAYRAALGFTEEDAPDPAEQMLMVGMMRGIFTADLTLALLNKGTEALEVEPIPPAIDPNDVAAMAADGDGQAAAEVAALIAALGGPGVARAMLQHALGLDVAPPPRPLELAAGGAPPNPR